MFPIFKLYHASGKDDIKHIYVFLNNDWIEENYFTMDASIYELDVAMKSKQKAPLLFIFQEEELDRIFLQQIKVTFLSQTLHLDDTITIIKSKIIEKTKLEISLPEIYLFGIREEKLNPQTIYDKLTQDGEIPLTKERLMQFLQNFVRFNIEDFKRLEKEEYTHEDIFPFTEKKELIKFPLGQKFILEKQYPFMVSPFDTFIDDPILEKHGDKIVSTENENLLLYYGDIHHNIIYICSALDILNNFKKNKKLQSLMLKIYYPLLYHKKITSLAQFKKKKHTLLATNKKLLDKNFEKYIHNINLFYNLYFNRKVILPVITHGIEQIHFIIHPLNIIHFPLDIIFKLIHVTQNIPLSKWNPGKRRENIYRIYTPEISKDGRKIPFLPKSEIMKMHRSIGRRKSVAFAILLEKKQYIICEFFDNGNVRIKCEFSPGPTSVIDIQKVEDIIKINVQPILNTIQKYLEQSGYSYFKFENFHMPNIEIIDIRYLYSIPVEQKSSLKTITDFKGCLSSIFNIMVDEDDGIILLFKRISHFNEMDSIDAFITYLHKHNYNAPNITEKLEETFGLNTLQATKKVEAWAQEQKIKIGRFEHKKLKIISNPGFPVDIHWENGHVNITVHDINNIYYLDTLPIYLNSMIKLTQYKNYMSEKEEQNFSKRINALCKKGKANVQSVFEDIKASSEQNLSDRKNIIVNDGRVIYNQSEFAADFAALLGSDDEDDDDEEDSYEDEDEPTDEEEEEIIPSEIDIQENIDGASLTNPNYFQRRLEHADPILFLKKKKGKFKQYSRSCAVNIRRQPVLLTDKQFNKIKTEMPEKIKMAVKYGSTKNKQFWYVCPQYWCLTENIPLTKEDLENAKARKIKLCGNSTNPYENIIPRDAKKVPEGKYIYSRMDFGQKKKKQVQETLYPSFFVGKHPSPNLCIPCCFNKPGGKQTQNREKCGAEIWDPKNITPELIKKKKTTTTVIKESNKYPLEKGEWGFLPMNIYHFLEIPQANIKCNMDGNICILRKGVEYSPHQSFIAAIAAIYKPHDPPSIKQMKKYIKQMLTLDSFITFQHGTLVESFKTNKTKTIHKDYYHTHIYKKLHKTTLGQAYLKEIISAYKNFKDYLTNETINIDYEYLWDIICTPHNNLFPLGINLILLTIPDNDITQKVDIICPSNHYANVLFHGNRPTAIILIRDNFYEPICERQKIVRGKDKIRTSFSLVGNKCPEGCPWKLKEIIQKMGRLIKNNCKFKKGHLKWMHSREYKYEFPIKQNISLIAMHKRLAQKKYKIIRQVVNLQTKVIGVIIQDKTDINKKVFVPCAPSIIQVKYPWILINDNVDWWQDYPTTKEMLQNIYEVNKQIKIPCKPQFKVINEGKIIGILTITNQFVPVIAHTLEDTYEDGLIPYFINVNIIEANKTIWESNAKDEERLEIVKKIKLETNFYNTFRNTLRILLNQYKFKKTKDEIETMIDDTTLSYWKKLERIIVLLKKLLNPFIDFVHLDIKNIDSVITCLNIEAQTCNTNSCGFSIDEGTCQLLVPQSNLISENDNETIYYGRMADELIRYGRIRSFMLQQNKFISFQNVGYNLKDNEVLLLEETLIDKYNNYFKNLQPIVINKYVSNPRTFYNAEPYQ